MFLSSGRQDSISSTPQLQVTALGENVLDNQGPEGTYKIFFVLP